MKSKKWIPYVVIVALAVVAGIVLYVFDPFQPGDPCGEGLDSAKEELQQTQLDESERANVLTQLEREHRVLCAQLSGTGWSMDIDAYVAMLYMEVAERLRSQTSKDALQRLAVERYAKSKRQLPSEFVDAFHGGATQPASR